VSYLSRPRIGFIAIDAMTNPSTANNENVIHLLDYDNVALLNPPVIDGVTLPEMSDAAYREWMTTLIASSAPVDQLEDPQQPNWQPTMPGYWNYWGDHLTTFGDARVNSVWIDDDPVTAPGSDPLLGAHVTFNARIVDTDPADTFTTQFVAAAFGVVARNARGELAEVIRGVPRTSFTRWLNFFRYRGAGTFQTVVPKDTLTFADEGEAPESAAFAALRDGALQGGGLLLRYCLYGMSERRNMLEMYDRFQQGEAAVNPKIGHVLGTIGVWNGTDMATAPVGRILQQPGPPFFGSAQESDHGPRLRVKTHEDVERFATPGMQLRSQGRRLGCAGKVGPAVAVVEGSRVVLDLLTAFPEIGCDETATGDPFEKHDFGPVRLELVYDAGGGPTTAVLGPVEYSRATYERLAGVWEVPFDPASEAGRNIDAGWLQLSTSAGRTLLREIEVVQVETDDRAIYLDLEPDGGGLRAQGTALLRVFSKGKPIEEPVTLEVQHWNDVQRPGEANSVNPLVVTACQIEEQPGDSFEVTVPPPGELKIPVGADAAGCYKLRFIPPGMHGDPHSPNFAVEYFTDFRVLPHDDYGGVRDEEITFDFVYREVFSYYAILYPVMSTIIPWGPDNTPHDPERVAQFAALISEAVDESRLGTALEMPITRELSAGKRQLLKRWCALQLRT
jgi:hypothetical protein